MNGVQDTAAGHAGLKGDLAAAMQALSSTNDRLNQQWAHTEAWQASPCCHARGAGAPVPQQVSSTGADTADTALGRCRGSRRTA